MTEPKHTIHIRIRDLRRERSLTQEELAGALGLSRQSINAMEAGRCLPSLPVALQIASFFSVPLGSVFEFPEIVQAYNQATGQEEKALTSLIPWSPLKEVREALGILIEDSDSWQRPGEALFPAINIFQTVEEIVAEVFIPGFTREQVSVEVGEDFLKIGAEPEEREDFRQYIRQEYQGSGFARTVALPALVEVDNAEAEMKYGVLTIRLAKVVEEKPKTAKIEIKSAE